MHFWLFNESKSNESKKNCSFGVIAMHEYIKSPSSTLLSSNSSLACHLFCLHSQTKGGNPC